MITGTGAVMMNRKISKKSRFTKPSFLVALILVLITILLAIIIYMDFIDLNIRFQGFFLTHWLSWIGTAFIAIYTPIYYILKRRFTSKFKTLLHIHVFGNLVSILLITTHFIQQISRPAEFYPDLGTGISLYAAVILLVLTGFLLRFQIAQTYRKSWKFIHTSAVTAFYLIILVHILQGLAII